MATAEQIKQLREQTGAGVLEAKKVLDEHGGDMNRALEILKARGIARAEKKAEERSAKDGLIGTYVHGNGRIGVIVEINSETDFVARLPEFQELAHAVALQVAAMGPKYVSIEDIPAADREHIAKTFEDATRAEGKPEAIIPKIVQGKVDKYYDEVVLLRQKYIKDDSKTIDELVKTVGAYGRPVIKMAASNAAE